MAELSSQFGLETEGGEEPESGRRRAGAWLRRALRELAETLIPAVVIALVINLFLAQATQVLGQSMEPTLYNSDRVVVEKVTYNLLHGPRRGDVIVIDIPGQPEPLIKRVVGLAGDTVEIRGGEVFIDGERLDEEWAIRLGGGNAGPFEVDPLHVFVLGDNRGSSRDSRTFGQVDIDQIIGRAWFIYWPFGHAGFVF